MKRHQLDPWWELRGFLHDIEIEDDVVVAIIAARHSLRYPYGSYEADFLLEHLTREKIGEHVAILNAEKDFRILWLDELPKSEEPTPFWKWFCKTYGYTED